MNIFETETTIIKSNQSTRVDQTFDGMEIVKKNICMFKMYKVMHVRKIHKKN